MTPTYKALSSNNIHLWFAKDKTITNANLLNQYYSLLSEAEQKRYQNFIVDKHRHQYLITRALLRTTLSKYHTDVAPHQWRFNQNPYGKPFQTNISHPPLYFNLSHTEGMIVLAIAQHEHIGVDIECIKPDALSVNVAKKYFSKTEVNHFTQLPKSQQTARFFDLWTLKEAYIKACGQGLLIPLDEFSFTFTGQRINIDFAPQRQDQPNQWRFWQMLPQSLAQPSRNSGSVFGSGISSGIGSGTCSEISPNEYRVALAIRQQQHSATGLNFNYQPENQISNEPTVICREIVPLQSVRKMEVEMIRETTVIPDGELKGKLTENILED